jgi:tetratricopeptide (TPR) repeat protein
MGLLDWLLRRKRPRAQPSITPGSEEPDASEECIPLRPENVQELGENSPLVFFQQNGAGVIMDRDAFDYTYGESRGPDPAQRDLDALLSLVTRVCVLEGAMLRGRAMGGPVLLDTSDAGIIRGLADCLRIVEDPSTFGHCHCLGGPTVELYAGPEHVATIGVQHGRAIRWKRWHHDAQLQDGDRLNHWLHDQGVDRARLAAIYERGNNFLFGGASPTPSEGQRRVRELVSQAQDRAQGGSLDEALSLCTRALEIDPDAAEAYAVRGQIHYHSSRLPEASADCSAAIARGVRHAEIYLIRAIALDDAGRKQDALAECSMALHLNPEHAGAYNSRGLIRASLGQFDEALGDFEQAIRLAPDWFVPYMHRAHVYHGRTQLDSALDDYDRAVERAMVASGGQAAPEGDPTLAFLFCRRGDARHDAFREEEAEADFAEAGRYQPAATAHYLGQMWLRRGKSDRALEAFADVVRLQPEDAEAYIGRGAAAETLDDLDQAAEDYSTAIRLRPDGGPVYVMRARVRHRQGRLDDALADLSEHLRIHPDDSMALLFRSSLHLERKAWAAALEDLNSAQRGTPDDPNVCNNLAWLLATCPQSEIRDGARAVMLARRACQATDWEHPFCLGTFAAALAETGAFEEAARWQSEALVLYPEEEKAAGLSRLALYQAGQPYRE